MNTHAIGLEDGSRFALACVALSLLGSLLGRHRKRRATREGRAPRPRKHTLLGFVVGQAIIVCLLWGYYRAGGWTLESVGVSSRVSPATALATGFGEYWLFVYGVRALLAGLGVRLSYLRASVRANATFFGGARRQRLALLTLIIVLNPFTEELLFRGLLVHQFALTDAPLWLALALGAGVNAVNHAYQGRLLVAFHLAFYAAVVALLYSPLGLLGAIGFHFGGDLVPLVSYRRQLAAYRNARRLERAKARAA